MAIVFLVLIAYSRPPAFAQSVLTENACSTSATTVVCTLTGVNQYDQILCGLSTDKIISSLADGVNTYTQRGASLISSATVHAAAYLYSAVSGAAGRNTLTITATLGSSGQSAMTCLDVVGLSSLSPGSTSNGTGTFNSGSSYSTAVGSYSPTIHYAEFVVVAGSACGAPAIPTAFPYGANWISGSGQDTGTVCTGSVHYQMTGGMSWKLDSSGSAVTDPFTIGGPSAAASNSANWAEIAVNFPGATYVTATGVTTQTLAMSIHSAVPNPANTETFAQSIHDALQSPLLTEPAALFTKYALPQPLNAEQFCQGIAITVNSVPTLTTPANCVQQVVTSLTLVNSCNFFQLQCWEYPLMFLGLYEGVFLGIALGFRFSEKGFAYFMLAGATYCSLIEINLGIMTPMVPIMLIVVNVAYSFRLDRLITSRGSSQQ